MNIRRLIYLAIALPMISCCNGSGTEEAIKADAPVLVSTEPATGATGVAISTKEVVFTFDQNIKILAADQSKVSITGGAEITKTAAYSKNVTVSITGLDYGKQYDVSIPAGVVQGYKDNQEAAAAASVSFTTEAAPVDPGTDERLSDVAWNLAAKMGLGWNMGNHMDAFYNGTWAGDNFLMPNETCWGAEPATQATFDGVKAAGFKSVRIPITWLKKIGPAPDYTIDAAWLNRVAEIVGYAEKAGLYVIINTHHDENHHSIKENGKDLDTRWLDILGASKSSEVNESIKKEITAVWTQIAEKFKDKGEWLIFESFNELNDGGWGWSASFRANPSIQCNILNEWNQVFVDAVRATGGNNDTRWLGVPTYAANPSFVDYLTLPKDAAGKIMVSVHFYDPSEYTIGDSQYSDWGHTGDAAKKASGGDEDHVRSIFGKLTADYVNKGIPVYVGEFGCSMRSKSDTRAWAFFKYYMEYIVKAAKTYGLPPFLWDNGATGSGQEHHGYINHGTGGYIGNSKEIVDLIVNTMNNESEGYTLETVYNKAPKL